MKKIIFSLVLIAASICSFAALAAQSEPAAQPFQDGQTVCFLGDSITHGGRFHYMIFDYYQTRFPDRNIRFVSVGVSGDSAGGAFGRLNEDVYPYNPDVLVLMMGMNDVGRGNYVAQPTAAQLENQEKSLNWHKDAMIRLIKAIAEKESPEFIFITPSPFDDTVVIKDRNNNQPGCTAALARSADFVRQIAPEYKALVVDFNKPMSELNWEQQKTNPEFTIIGPDRVHPRGPGHLMMAWLFLKSQNVPAVVSNVEIDAASQKIVAVQNATVEKLTFDVKEGQNANAIVAFTLKQKALPFPIADDAKPILELEPIIADLNQEIFAVKGLADGKYTLKIDDSEVGVYTAPELAAGVNLAMNDKTPQYQQAQKVLKMSADRRTTELKLRDFAAVRWFLRRHVNPDDLAAVAEYAETKMNKTGYFEEKVPGYIKGWPTRPEIVKTLDEQTAAIHDAAQPMPHDYKLIPID